MSVDFRTGIQDQGADAPHDGAVTFRCQAQCVVSNFVLANGVKKSYKTDDDVFHRITKVEKDLQVHLAQPSPYYSLLSF